MKNIAATDWASESLLLAPADAGFRDFIEPGVLPLVDAVVARGWITYTSCEGHFYGSARPDERHVGIVPANAAAAAEIRACWGAIAAEWDEARPAHPCEMAIMGPVVRCERGISLNAIDLYIARRDPAPWPDYFRALDEASAFAAERLG